MKCLMLCLGMLSFCHAACAEALFDAPLDYALSQEWFVSPEGDHTVGTHWASAFTNIQAAVDVAASNDTIWVTNGVYTPIVTSNKAIAIQSMNGAEFTIIDGGGTNRCATLGNPPAENATLLLGFTLRNGATNGSGGGAIGGTLNHCIVSSNWSFLGGGAYQSVLNYCVLVGNSVNGGSGGGAAFSDLNQCLVIENFAPTGGGANGSYLNNCTIVGNTAYSGAGVNTSMCMNCISWGNLNNGKPDNANKSALYDSYVEEANSLLGPPQFVDSANGDFRLLSTSPCVGTGNTNWVVLPLDLFGNPMIENGAVNQGAIAGFVASREYYVDLGQTTNMPDGLTWETAFTNIQHAADIASVSDTVWVMDGSYPPIHINNKTITIRSVNGAAYTIIDGGYSNRCVTLGAPDQTNTLFIGFTLQNGHTLEDGGGALGGTFAQCIFASNSAVNGGGVYGAVLTNCILFANFTANGGGGSAHGILNDCIISNNFSAGDAGGAWGGTLVDCELIGNQAVYWGGGALGNTLSNCMLANNSADWGGGASFNTLNNCILKENSAQLGGGAYNSILNNCVVTKNEANIGGGTDSSVLNNCTVVGNGAQERDGGASAETSQSLLRNSILWLNTNAQGKVANISSNIQSISSCYVGWTNTAADSPKFVDLENDDFRLYSSSPCVGAGATNLLVLSRDMFGNAMVERGKINQGAIAGSLVPRLTVSPTSVHAQTYSSTNLQFILNANIAWSVSTTNEWIHILTTNGAGSNVLTVTLSEKPSLGVRVGHVEVQSQNAEVGIRILLTIKHGEFDPTDYYVDWTQTNHPPTGTNWMTAFANLQEAVDAAIDGDRIWVTNGIYEPIATDSKLLVIRSLNGAEWTIIDGGKTNRCAMLGESSNTNTCLIGFTLQNGRTLSSGGGACGGIVNNCIIISNWAHGVGGGAMGGTLNNCIIVDNQSDVGGGGACSSTLNNCTVVGNLALYYDSGTCQSTLNNSIVWGNTNQYGDMDNSSGYGTWGHNHVGTSPDPQSDSPKFVDWENGDFRLYSISPCVGMGDINWVQMPKDIFGNPMIVDGKVNKGAVAEVVAYLVTTNNQVPYLWLEEYGLVEPASSAETYESADLADRDNDGFANWEEYIAGTNPTNEHCFFKAGIGTDADGAVIWWMPNKSGRVYDVLSTDNVTNPFSTWGTTNADSRFFRIKVRMAE